jgi:hypothetical protein
MNNYDSSFDGEMWGIAGLALLIATVVVTMIVMIATHNTPEFGSDPNTGVVHAADVSAR